MPWPDALPDAGVPAFGSRLNGGTGAVHLRAT
jgi:hypothetical protein